MDLGIWDFVLAALTDFDVAGIDDTASHTWRVYFPTPVARDNAATALHEQFPALAIAAMDLPDEEWAARSQAGLTAVRVGRIVVAPPWDVGGSGNPEGLPCIVIQPSMGFGTGHHATTRLCLLHLQELDLRHCTALDVGTGSGVLAIAASRLGATQVLAIDDDPDAIQSARESVVLNPGSDVTLAMADVRRATLRPFDLVIANLTGALLAAAAARLQQLTAAGGRLILSGFMATEEEDVLAAFSSATVERRSQEDEWVCVTISSQPRRAAPPSSQL